MPPNIQIIKKLKKNNIKEVEIDEVGEIQNECNIEYNNQSKNEQI